MAREDESRHKSKRHKRDRERDEEKDKDHAERDRKKHRVDKPSNQVAPLEDATKLHGSGAAEIERPPDKLENGIASGESREDTNGEVSMSVEETHRCNTTCFLPCCRIEIAK